ncbi:phosphoribosylaminoimidazolesuccinocarboxamide synthase [Myxococcota bacterium]
MGVTQETLRQQLEHTLAGTDLPGLGAPERCGSHDIYDLGDYALLVVTDRVCQGTRTLGTAPFKGEAVTRLATWWLNETADLAESPIEKIVDPQALLVRKIEPLGCLFSAHAFLSGDLWAAYQTGFRCESALTDGMTRDQPLTQPVATPLTRVGGLSTHRAVVNETGMAAPLLGRACKLALRLFERACQLGQQRGVTLRDSLYTFGVLADGELGVVALLHAPPHHDLLPRR